MSLRTPANLSVLKIKEKALFRIVIGMGILVIGSILTGIALLFSGFSADAALICFAISFFASFATIFLAVLTAPNFH